MITTYRKFIENRIKNRFPQVDSLASHMRGIEDVKNHAKHSIDHLLNNGKPSTIHDRSYLDKWAPSNDRGMSEDDIIHHQGKKLDADHSGVLNHFIDMHKHFHSQLNHAIEHHDKMTKFVADNPKMKRAKMDDHLWKMHDEWSKSRPSDKRFQ